MKNIRKLTIASQIVAGFMWMLALLVLLFNLLGLWNAWQLAGYGCYGCILVSLVLSLITFQASRELTDAALKKKYVRRNGITLIISAVIILLDMLVFSTWFWG